MKNNQNSRRTIKKYFFDNTSTLLLPFFFFTLSLIVFIQQFSFFSIKNLISNNDYLGIIQIYVLLLGLIAAVFVLLKKMIIKSVAPSIKKVEPFIIESNKDDEGERISEQLKYDKEAMRRDEQQKKLRDYLEYSFNKEKHVIIVGKSGSGKSTLVRKYEREMEEYESANVNIRRYQREDYRDPTVFESELQNFINKSLAKDNEKRNIIILDQFERAIEDKHVFSCIINLLKLPEKKISVAFVCMPEDYAKIVEKLQSELIFDEKPEGSYDVFISFKHSDSKGQRTLDSEIAEKLYTFLKNKGVNVFYSNKELGAIGTDRYKDAIDAALESANILIAVGSSEAHLSAQWVKYEWGGFLHDILSNKKKNASIFTLYYDMNPGELPKGLRERQAFNANADNAFEDLYGFVINNLSSIRKVPVNRNQEKNGQDPKDENVFEYNSYFLKMSAKENQEMLSDIEKKLKLPKAGKHMEFFEKLINDPDSDSISMIEINMALKHFQTEGISESSKILSEKNPMELIKEVYFEKVLALTENPDIAMVILYALSNCGYSGGLRLSDFKNLTFAPQDNIVNILSVFEEQRIIKKITPELKIDSPYIIAHDYIIRYLENYCRRKLSEQVSTNIRDYCEIYNQLRIKDAGKNHNTGSKIPLTQYYKTADSKTSKISNFIAFCMTLLGITVLVITVWNKLSGYDHIRYFNNMEYEWNHLTHALTILAVGCAIFYVYHYLQYFAKIFFFKKFKLEWWICSFLIVGGMTIIAFSLIYPSIWASWIAGGWTIIGILHVALSRYSFVNENSKKRLMGEGWLYFIVAFLIISLNFTILRLDANMYPYYPLFIFFVVITIRQHINTDWMLAKKGTFVNLSIKDGTQ